jgi:hypothetical protein
VITGLLLATLFVPAVVLIVPLYLEIVHPPLIHHSFIDSYWAVWMPAGASAFNVVLIKRFFDNLPRELFEAARIDGAGPFRRVVSGVLARRLHLRHPRYLAGLPVAVPRPHQSRQAATLRPAAVDPGADAAWRVPRRAVHRLVGPYHRLPDLPALVPAWDGPGRRDQGLTPAKGSVWLRSSFRA